MILLVRDDDTRDITERLPSAIALRASESLLARVGAVAGIGGWELDLLADVLTWSAETLRLHEVDSRFRPTRAHAISFYLPQSRPLIERALHECIEHGQPYDVEGEVRSAKGRVFWARATGSAEIQDGKAVRLVGIFQDIAARKALEARVQEGERTLIVTASTLRTVLDSTIEVAIIAGDPRLTITMFNAGAERLLGYASEELVGRATLSVVHDADEIRAYAEELSTRLGHRIEGSEVFTSPATFGRPREWSYLRKDGTRLAVSLVVTPMYASEGELLGYVCVAHNVSRQKQYAQSLRAAMVHAEHANSAKSEFLANMSHEIRTPLNAVIGLGYLLEQTTLGDDQRQFVSKIQFAGRALLGVIDNVLDLSKIEAGEMSLEEKFFDLPHLVRELSQMLAPQAMAKGIELSVEQTGELPRLVTGDASRLRQILTNLLSNSIKFTEVGGVTLKLSAATQTPAGFQLRCEVDDTGIGIDPEALERLFTPFTQADTSTTRRFGGTGLGLSIAYRLVELMGGVMGVTSTLAKGSTFWAEIPLGTTPAIDTECQPNPVRGLQIVIAESSGDRPRGLGEMARSLGWRPRIVRTGEEVLGTLRTSEPHGMPEVLILEMELSDTDAPALIARIREECPGIELPAMVVVANSFSTARALEGAEPELLAAVSVMRPVTSSALFNAINSAVFKRLGGPERIMQSPNFDEPDAQWLAGVRVLVVDDSDINSEVAKRILEHQGATVTTRSDGHAAVEYLRAGREAVDIVLMDVQMPILDGNEATRRIRGELQLAALPIVALTAGALVAERQKSVEAGMNDFVSKPFEPHALIRKVRHLVEEARGEPIKMVTHERTPAAPGASRPVMASIDAEVVQQMFGDDLLLFKSILARMLKEYADVALPTALSVGDQRAQDLLKARVHKLKGSAGMVGAHAVMRLAAATEGALRDGRPAAAVDAMLAKLAAALTTLRVEAEPFLAGQTVRGTATTASGTDTPRMGLAEVETLLALLESMNLAALDKFAALSTWLSELIEPARFERLREAIESLDFPRAAEHLRESLQGFGAAAAAGAGADVGAGV